VRCIGDERPRRIEQRAAEIQSLLDVHGVRRVLQTQAHLLGNVHEQIVEYLQPDRIDAHFRVPHVCAAWRVGKQAHASPGCGIADGDRVERAIGHVGVGSNLERSTKPTAVGEHQRQATNQLHRFIRSTNAGENGTCTEFADVYPETLSGGMQQRVAIARTLALRPSVILMDEPFGALDAQTRSDMQQLLLQIWDETACTILFVTHDVEEAVYLADRIFIMSSHPGTIVEDVHVPFDRPRDLELKEKSEFHELQHYVLGRLKSAPGIGGHVRVSI